MIVVNEPGVQTLPQCWKGKLFGPDPRSWLSDICLCLNASSTGQTATCPHTLGTGLSEATQTPAGSLAKFDPHQDEVRCSSVSKTQGRLKGCPSNPSADNGIVKHQHNE